MRVFSLCVLCAHLLIIARMLRTCAHTCLCTCTRAACSDIYVCVRACVYACTCTRVKRACGRRSLHAYLCVRGSVCIIYALLRALLFDCIRPHPTVVSTYVPLAACSACTLTVLYYFSARLQLIVISIMVQTMALLQYTLLSTQLTHGVRAHVDYALCAMYYVRVRSNYSVVRGTSYLYYVHT